MDEIERFMLLEKVFVTNHEFHLGDENQIKCRVCGLCIDHSKSTIEQFLPWLEFLEYCDPKTKDVIGILES